MANKKHSHSRHGGYAAVRKFRAGKIDGRTKEGRYLESMREKFIADLGGTLNAAEEIILDRILEGVVFVRTIVKHTTELGIDIIHQDGGLIPPLKESYLSYCNTLAKNIRLLYQLAERKKKTDWLYEEDGYVQAITGKLKGTSASDK